MSGTYWILSILCIGLARLTLSQDEACRVAIGIVSTAPGGRLLQTEAQARHCQGT